MLSLRKITIKHNKEYYFKNLNVDFSDKSLNLISAGDESQRESLLNVIYGLDKPYSGKIFYKNIHLKNNNFYRIRNRYISYILKIGNIIRDFNTEENLNLSLDLTANKDKKALELLKDVFVNYSDDELNVLLSKNNNELSTFERRTISIASSLIKEPKILLIEEPLSDLSDNEKRIMISLLSNISKKIMVIATAENKFDFTDINFTLYEINEHYLCIYKDLVKIKSNKNKLTLKKHYISFKNLLKLSSRNIKHTKTNLIFLGFSTIIIGFLGLFLSLQTCDTNKVLLEQQINKGTNYLFLNNERHYYDHDDFFEDVENYSFFDEQINDIKDYSKDVYSPYYNIDEFHGSIGKDTFNYYFSSFLSRINSIELDENQARALNLRPYDKISNPGMCRLPNCNAEVAISDYMAELYMKGGIYCNSSEETKDKYLFKPSKVDELIGKTMINGFTITGIYSSDDSILKIVNPYKDVLKQDAINIPTFNYLDKFRNSFSISQCFILNRGYRDYSQSLLPEPYRNNCSKYLIKITGDYKKDIAFIKSLAHKNLRVCASSLYSNFTYLKVLFNGGPSLVISSCVLSFLLIIDLIIMFILNNRIFIQSSDMILKIKVLGAPKGSIKLVKFFQTFLIAIIILIISIILMCISIIIFNCSIGFDLLYLNIESIGWLYFTIIIISTFIDIFMTKKYLKISKNKLKF